LTNEEALLFVFLTNMKLYYMLECA